jgi:hypothetical protein
MPKRTSPSQDTAHQDDSLLTPLEAMKFLGYKSLNSLYRARTGGLTPKRINRRTLRYWRSELIRFLEEGAKESVFLSTGLPKQVKIKAKALAAK